MRKNSTFQQKPLATFGKSGNTGKKKEFVKQTGIKNKTENPDLDGAELFSRFTADIIKQQVLFTR